MKNGGNNRPESMMEATLATLSENVQKLTSTLQTNSNATVATEEECKWTTRLNIEQTKATYFELAQKNEEMERKHPKDYNDAYITEVWRN